VSTVEVLVGKMLAFGLVAGGIAAMTVVLLVGVFGIPMLADPWTVVGVIALLLAASLGIGALIAVVSDSERQAVQLSLLLLLASVFFSGFVLAIEEFSAPVRAIAALLPVTHGIRLLQDLMLRGTITQAWSLVALALIALTSSWASWALLRRGMSRG
jgi:ABC-2 type transport system permease protein